MHTTGCNDATWSQPGFVPLALITAIGLVSGPRSSAQRLIPVVATGIFDRHNPPHVERELRHVEFAHRRCTKLVFGQELWLIVLHEPKKPVAASAPFFVRLFRELLLSVVHDGILLRDAAAYPPSEVGERETAPNREKMPKIEQFIRDFSILSLCLTTTFGCIKIELQLIV